LVRLALGAMPEAEANKWIDDLIKVGIFVPENALFAK
jgi:hypothetical protein